MSEAKARIWSLSDFLLWEKEQERRYELVEGQAVLLGGRTQTHALIAANIVSGLRALRRGSPCRASGSDARNPIEKTGNARYADVTIDCGPFRPEAHDASGPRVVFEVLSQSTGWDDQTRKLRDDERVESIQQYGRISQSQAHVSLWLKGEDGRLVPQDDIRQGELAIHLGPHAPPLAVADIYDGTGLASEPPAATG